MQFHEIINNTIFIFTRPLDPEKITKSYALFEHMHFTNYTFFITSKNDKGTANSTSQVFVPSYEKGIFLKCERFSKLFFSKTMFVFCSS